MTVCPQYQMRGYPLTIIEMLEQRVIQLEELSMNQALLIEELSMQTHQNHRKISSLEKRISVLREVLSLS